MDIRRLLVIKDVVYAEGGLPAMAPVTRAAACAVIANPLAGRAQEYLDELIPFGEDLGKMLVQEALKALPLPRVVPMARPRSSAPQAISSMARQSCIRAWASRCARRSAAGRRSFPPT